jgi:hypothetical protein
MKIVADIFCWFGGCPKVYKDIDGTFYVQGYVVDNPRAKIPDLPQGETLVRIDPELLKAIQKSDKI